MIPLALGTFLLFGGVLVLVGASQAPLARALGLDLAGSGLLAAALSLGLGAGIVGAGPLADRWPRRPLFVGACAAGAVALALAGRLPGLPGALAVLGVTGLAAGALQTLANASLVDRYGDAAARPLAGVHLGATAGAILGPPLLGALAKLGDWTLGFRALGGAFALLGIWGLAVSHPPPSRPPERAPIPWRALAPVAAMAGCYVGVETALTVFAVPWAAALDLSEARGLRAISAFWAGLLVGRAALAWRGGASRPARVGGRALGGAALLAAALLLELTQLEVALAAVGAALGAVFPLLIALAARRAPDARGTAVGIVAGAGAVGGFCIPWLAGTLGDALGVRAGLASLVLWSLALAALAFAAARPSPPRCP